MSHRAHGTSRAELTPTSSSVERYSGSRGRRVGRLGCQRDGSLPEHSGFRASQSRTVVGEERSLLQDEDLRARNLSRFSNGNKQGHAPASQWSDGIWRKQEDRSTASQSEIAESGQGAINESTRSASIGLGHATGLSRVPDEVLAKNPHVVANRLDVLSKRARLLEEEGKALVSTSERPAQEQSAAPIAEWEHILGEYRQLTMAITASSVEEMQDLAIPVYEAAADACLLGGNLSFYLSCQTRLLQDLYEDDSRQSRSPRRFEFLGYSLLYFGVFCADGCELARIMMALSNESLRAPGVKLAFSITSTVRNGDGAGFIAAYERCNIRQKTLLHPRLASMRAIAIKAVVQAYLELDRQHTLSLLRLKSESEVLQLLESERPDLVEQNSRPGPGFTFRLPGKK